MTNAPSSSPPDATERLPQPDSASVPRRFGRYEVEKVLGRGAMGWVVLARDLTLQRPVALKLFRVAGDEAAQRQVKKRYVDEARAAARLVHPHILQIYEVGLHEGWVYIAMEVLPGGDLRTAVQARGVLGWFEACKLILQAADGLVYAHQQGVLHRDIKPANLMLTQRGDCKVVDFGLTTRIDAPIGEPGAGTPNYQSPESARGHNGPQNDVWGLAASLWFLLTGTPPFALDTPKDVLRIHAGLDLPDLRTLRPDVPEPVVRVIEQALAKHPGERFHLAEDFARVLQLASEHATQARPGPVPTAFQRPVNPELVELADAAGASAERSVSRSVSHGRAAHRPASATPVWVYGVIAALFLVAVVGTLLIVLRPDDASDEARDGSTAGLAPPTQSPAEPSSPPGGPGSADAAGPGNRDAPPDPWDAAPGTAPRDRGTVPRGNTVADELARITAQFGADPGLSETLGGLGFAASSAAEGFPARLALDGDLSTAWQTDSRGWGHNELLLDLGDVMLLESVTLHWGEPLPPEAMIKISVDARSWTVFSRLQPVEGQEDWRQPPFAEEARYIRIETRGESTGAPDIRLREVELVYE